jgi:uncharacterized repeat protein (TIGR01451 family)
MLVRLRSRITKEDFLKTQMRLAVLTFVVAVVVFPSQAATTVAPPVVTMISPSTGSIAGGTIVAITGSNFVVGATTFAFGGAAGTSVSCSSTTACTATSPAGTGTVGIRATTASGTSADTATDDFTYTAPSSTACAAFATATNFPAGTAPYSVAIGDFNSDGRSDLAVPNNGSNDVSILLGSGSGTFAAAMNFAVGQNPRSVAIGEFNGDGVSDLAVANSFSNSVSILLGTGTGAFGPATDFAVGLIPFAVAVGDFNGDGISDLAVANNESNNVSILLGTGAGTFGAATNFGVGSAPNALAIGDFNGDGRSDLAVANGNIASNTVSILLGSGIGTFGTATDFATGGVNPASVAIGDFNGDGTSDLAVVHFVSNDVAILPGTGTGTFGAATTFATGGVNPIPVAVGDFNGDGISDLAVTNFGSNNVAILIGTGSGTFAAASSFAVGSGPLSVAIGDFNRDGRSDVAVANLNSNDVSILLNSTAPGALSTALGWVTLENTGTVTITVTRTGGSDCTVSVNYTTADGTAVAGADYTATSGTLTFGPGVLSQSFTVAILDDAISEPIEDFTVTLTNPSGGATLLAPTVETVTIVDDDPLPTLSIDSVTQVEGNSGMSNFVFTVTLTGATEQDVSVKYATADGSADATDYSSASGTLTFTPGVMTQTISVPVIGDTINEANEQFTVTLSAPVNATITTAIGTGTIVNDDAAPTLAIDNVTQAEGNSGTTNFVFTVMLAGSTAQSVSVNYATADGTAAAGSDYSATSGVLTFAPGVTTQSISVPVIGDAINETDETFTVTLSSPVNASITTGTGIGTIVNDDVNADLSIVKSVVGSGPFFETQNASFNITVTNAGPSGASNVTVTDVLPAGTTFIAATSTQGSCSGTTTITCSLGTLANGAQASIALTVRLDESGSMTNVASVTSSNPDPTIANSSSSATITVQPASDIPTLSEWMLLLLAAMLAAMGGVRARS